MTRILGFGGYSEEMKQIFREMYNVEDWDQETKALLPLFHEWYRASEEKDQMKPKEFAEIKKRFEDCLHKWLETHDFSLIETLFLFARSKIS